MFTVLLEIVLVFDSGVAVVSEISPNVVEMRKNVADNFKMYFIYHFYMWCSNDAADVKLRKTDLDVMNCSNSDSALCF